MNKNILLASASPHRRFGLDVLLDELSVIGYKFRRLGNKKHISKTNEQWPFCTAGSFLIFGPKTKDLVNSFVFILLLPLIWFLSFVYFWLYCSGKKIDALFCYGINEKIALTFMANLFNIKVLWLEFPEIDYSKTNKILLWIYRRLSKRATLVVFNSAKIKELHKIKVNEANISQINPGVRMNFRQHQDNLFNSLAQVDKANFHKNFFTIGIVADLDERQNLEAIFQSVQKSLDMIPNLQLIIVGDGEERKNLSWLAKRMKIDNLVWFVGEQKHLRKWLDSFDLYLISAAVPRLDDYNYALEAMQAGLPVIGPINAGLEDIVEENKNGVLIEMDNSEMLSLQIIKLQQDKELRDKLGQIGNDVALKHFSIISMVERFKQIL